MLPIIIAAKVRIKSCRLAIECVFICTCMDVTLHEHTQIVARVACRVGSQQFQAHLHN